MKDVERLLQAARQNLLDLTMRNRLLNFRPSKARTVRVVDEIPREVYDVLVLKEKEMEFRPKPEKSKSQPTLEHDEEGPFEGLETDVSGLTEEETSKLWELPPPDAKVADRHVDRFLQTPLEGQLLQKRLFYINQQARSVLEEQGYTILYLAIGFLEWTESPDALQSRRAPLILVPLEVERTRVGTSFKLRWTQEDILTNISLQAKVSEQGVLLPEFEMPDDKAGIVEYFQSVVVAVSSIPNWRVVTDIYLDFFSFTKFVMYKDLDFEAWPEGRSPADHPLITAVLDPSPGAELEQGFSESEVDEKITAHNVYYIMDADPSQIAVIEDSKVGRNLVVEGPPGTGKSQTITNIIAELLAAGKSVLFVSEKMAALDVVKSRLDRVGLGDFCLELHSRKSNKREVLRELERSISSPPPRSVSLEEKFEHLETLKSELNGYARALREPFEMLGRSPFGLFHMKEKARRRFAKAGRAMPRVIFADPEKCHQREWVTAVARLTNLVEALPLVKPLAIHPWRGCKPGTVLPSDVEEIGRLIGDCKEAIDCLEASVGRLVEACAVKRPTTLEDLPNVITAAKIIAVSKPVDRHVLLNREWNKPSQQAEALIQKVEELQTQLSTTLSKFQAKALDQDIVSMVADYKDLCANFFRILNSKYRYLKREIFGLYSGQAPRENTRIISDLEQLVRCQKLREEVRQAERVGQELFGSHWQGRKSHPQSLRTLAEWIVPFRQQLLDGVLSELSVDIVSRGISQGHVEKAAEEVDEAGERFFMQSNQLVNRIGADCEAIFHTNERNIAFSDLSPRLELWKSELPRIQRWAQFTTLRDACITTVAKPVVETIESDVLEPEDVIPCFEGNFADDLLRIVFAQRPELANFDGDLHEYKIKRFMDLDSELISRNRGRLAHKLYQNRPRISGGASSGSEAGILLGEFGRRRRHMPIRKLMSLAGRLIQQIKPCFMMSPLSIAQFLDPRTVRFDVIVFDEASQVRPEDALGALLRGNQVIVMGDTRQLPPTSFFDHIIEAREDEDPELAAPVADIESILHLCKLKFPAKTLRWHYRSRHESLIAVSNQEFYDNRLLIYPSPIDRAKHLGLQFVHLRDATYDRGRSSVNRQEARAVAKAAFEHYRTFPHKSLGVGAFNIRQQQAIFEEVELQLRRQPEMEEFFKSSREEHFFVKNLETIQGDERDVIFLSIGFGFDPLGRLSLNFGPLNHDGGERRLNVLISRARERCVVFSNFRASDMKLDGTAKFGLRALKVFLDYAENRILHTVEETREDAGSPFEDSVYDFLRGYGHEVRKQVGCAGFRVDLAVVDPEALGRYLLGIECDGAKYHSSPVARDRDRLRQQILEGLGWRLHRIWSTDWYRNPGESERRLLDAVERAKHEKRTVVDVVDDPAPHRDVSTPQSDAERVKSPESSTVVDTIYSMVSNYELCSSLGITTDGELHEQSTHQLSKAVIRVVDVEGPVHLDEVVRRIRSLWGLKRSGQRIYDAISRAASLAKRNGQIGRRGSFLWPATEGPIKVRRRYGDPPARIHLICDEEIAEALKLVLKHQFDTLSNDLIVQASRLLSIQAIHDTTSRRIEIVIRKLVDEGQLQQMPNGMIHLPKF